MNRFLSQLLALTLAAGAACIAKAQVNYAGGVYSQNFNTLPGTANNTLNLTWTDNTTLPGWYASKTTFSVTDGTLGGTAATFDSTSTTANNVGLFSFGTAAGADRALGCRATSNFAGNDPVLFGVRLVNTSGKTLTKFTVTYTGEQWFKSSQATAHTLLADYQLGATSLSAGTWTAVSAGTFTAPIGTGTTATALNGNTTANRTVKVMVVSGVSWAPGQELWIRFRDANETGNEQGLAVDDFNFIADDESGLFFNGSTSYVTMGFGAAASPLNASSFTVECRFMRTGPGVTASTGTGGIVANPLVAKGVGESDGSNVDANYFLGIDANGKLVADFEQFNATSNNGTNYPAGQNFPATGSTVLQDGVFYHVAATYDAATATWKLYVNGVPETVTLTIPTFVGVVPRNDNIQGLGIGTTINSTGARSGFFQGFIDEVRIWNVARSASEVLTNKDIKIAVGTPGLLGRYGFDEATGTTAAGINAAGGAAPVGTLSGTTLPQWTNSVAFTPNALPTVTLTSPTAAYSGTFPATVNFAATASDSDGTIAKVEFYNGAAKVGEDFTAPYTYDWTGVAVGTYTLKAVAYDNAGGSATSDTVAITVSPNPNQAPQVTLAGPANNATGLGSGTTLDLGIADPEGDGVTVTYYGRVAAPAAPAPDFSIIAVPDTQYYSENINSHVVNGSVGANASIFYAQTQWIADNQAARKIAFVSHMGDIAQNGDTNQSEWVVADTAMKTVENPALTLRAHGIPWGVAPGNHDQGTTGNGDAGAQANYYMQYFNFNRWDGRPYYGGHFGTKGGVEANTNSYQLFSAGGLDFIIIHMEYDVRALSFYQPVLDWADAVLKAYPNRRAIITSHWIVNTGNPATFSTQGQNIYNALKNNPNLFLMLCGHVNGEGMRSDTFNGHTVYSILQDYQETTNGGNGFLRIYTFSPANNTIKIESYSPTLNRAINASDSIPSGNNSSIVIPYNMQTAVTDWIPLGTVTVPPGGTAAPLAWTGLEKGKSYEWYATVNDGINTTTTATSRFSTTASTPPTVSVTSPIQNATYGLPATITLSADASDTDGTIARVEFFNGSTKIGEATSAPFTATWNNVPAGNYALTAVATDDSGLDAISGVVNVTVSNSAPSVVLTSPVAGAGFDALASITLTADATDTDGTVSKVEFFNGPTKLATVTAAPFQFIWSDVISGSYTLTAKATDDQGAVTTSDPVNVTVTNADNVAPVVALSAPASSVTIGAAGTYTLTATASDSDGNIAKVEFFNGETKLGEDTTAPFSYTWTNIPAGTYSVTAVATDNDGAVTVSAASTLIADPTLWSYAQNFDGLGTAGTNLATLLPEWSFFGNLGGGNSTWTDSIPIPASGIGGGAVNNTVTVATTFTTSSNTAGFNFALPATPNDRALGTSPTSGEAVVLQLTLTNPTGAAISALNIGYDIRRFTTVATANELPGYQLFYSLDNGTSWTNVSTLNPTVSGPTGIIVPNTVGVTTVSPTTVTLGSPWAAGAMIRFRWVDDNAVATSPDQIYGLDNVSISAAQVVTVVGQPPTVSLSAPTDGATFFAPANITLTAAASDSDGTVTKVEFFNGSTKLGEVATAPFNYAWNNVAVGSYSLTAKATDNDNNVVTSSPVSVTVSTPPGSSGSLLRGPYLNMANQNSIVIRWRSSLSTVGRVRYGDAPDNLTQFTDEASAKTDHEVRLTGLTPYSRYYYSVGSAVDSLTPEASDTTTFRPASVPAAPVASDYTFRTSPVPGTATDTRIWIVGDCGRGSASQASGRDAYYTWMGNRVPDLNLQMGDNAYNSGTDTEYQTGYFLMYPSLFRKMPQWSTLGNHDANNGVTNPTTNFPYFDMFTFPTAGEAGGVASGTEHYYSFDYGNIHFICLDSQASSTNTIEKNGADGPMAAWLRQDLAGNTATWTIAFWHHPPYSKGSHDSDTETQMVNMRTNFNPILEAGGVDMVFNGHSHNYERSVLLDGNYGITTTITSAMKLNAGNGSTTGFTTGPNGVIRNASTGFTAVATVNGTVIPPDGAYRKPLTGPRDHFGAVYNTAGMSGQADGGSLNHSAMYISYNSVGTVNLDINGNTLVATYVQAGGTAPDNYTIIKQGAADSDADGIPDDYEIANGLDRHNALDADLDLDGDGLSNRLEYALGTAANSPNRAGLPVLGQGIGVDAGKLTFTFNRARAELSYVVQASDDLKAWTDLVSNPGTAGSSVTVTDANTASLNRFLRLKVTDGIASVTTTPIGRMTYTLGQGQEAPVVFSLNAPIGSITGAPAGFITAVGTNTLDNASAGWNPGELSQAATPYLLRIISGPATGVVFPVSTSIANTSTRLTLVTAGVDLTTLGITPGQDSYELVPADTLDTLFSSGILKTGADITTADSIRLWNGSTWVYYFNNGTGWQRSGIGAAPNVLVRPDRGWILKRVGPTATFVVYGQVSSTSARVTVARGANTFAATLPVSATFDELALQNSLPNWSSDPANPSAGDQVRIWNGSTWLVYIYVSGQGWVRPGVGAAGSTVLAKPGRPFLIVRPNGVGTDLLLHTKTY